MRCKFSVKIGEGTRLDFIWINLSQSFDFFFFFFFSKNETVDQRNLIRVKDLQISSFFFSVITMSIRSAGKSSPCPTWPQMQDATCPLSTVLAKRQVCRPFTVRVTAVSRWSSQLPAM